MNISGSIAIYVLFVIVFLVFSYLGIYHLRRFGYAGDLTKPIIFLYSLVSLVVIIGSIVAIVYALMGAI